MRNRPRRATRQRRSSALPTKTERSALIVRRLALLVGTINTCSAVLSSVTHNYWVAGVSLLAAVASYAVYLFLIEYNID